MIFQFIGVLCEFDTNSDSTLVLNQGIEGCHPTGLSDKTEDKLHLAESLFGDFKVHFL
jgi:hypothetical protein